MMLRNLPPFSLTRAPLGLLLAAILSLAGCARSSRTLSPTSPTSPTSPGVEVLAWVIDDTSPPAALLEPTSAANPAARNRPKPPPKTVSLAEALAPFQECPVPMPESVRAAWRANGLRVMALPKFVLPELQKTLRIAGPVRQQFFAQTPRWAEVFRGATASGTHPIAIDLGESRADASSSSPAPTAVDISSGAFRFLMRNWLSPAGDDRPAATMRLDLVPQHTALTGNQSPARLSMQGEGEGGKDSASITDEGVVFEQLLYEVSLSGDEILIIFPESSGPLTAPHDDPIRPDHPFGPGLPDTPTLGDALLSDALIGGPGRTRIILIFSPTVPASFSIAP